MGQRTPTIGGAKDQTPHPALWRDKRRRAGQAKRVKASASSLPSLSVHAPPQPRALSLHDPNVDAAELRSAAPSGQSAIWINATERNEGERARSLILKHASLSRPSGEWSEDDYDVPAKEDRRLTTCHGLHPAKLGSSKKDAEVTFNDLICDRNQSRQNCQAKMRRREFITLLRGAAMT